PGLAPARDPADGRAAERAGDADGRAARARPAAPAPARALGRRRGPRAERRAEHDLHARAPARRCRLHRTPGRQCRPARRAARADTGDPGEGRGVARPARRDDRRGARRPLAARPAPARVRPPHARTADRRARARTGRRMTVGVRERFGDNVAVDGVDLTVQEGEVFGLLGPNGAGKTTLIRLMNTLLPLQEGEIAVFGNDVRRAKTSVRRLLGYVPQQLSIEGALTGRENVMWFARLFDVPRAERRERVDTALESMALTDAANRLANTYSGGMVRRLELAQALVNRPALLILDEPTIGLDPVARDSVWQRVEELRDATGMTVLLTTHYMEEAD